MDRTLDLHKLIHIYRQDYKQENQEIENVDPNEIEFTPFVRLALMVLQQLGETEDIIKKMPSLYVYITTVKFTRRLAVIIIISHHHVGYRGKNSPMIPQRKWQKFLCNLRQKLFIYKKAFPD